MLLLTILKTRWFIQLITNKQIHIYSLIEKYCWNTAFVSFNNIFQSISFSAQDEIIILLNNVDELDNNSFNCK